MPTKNLRILIADDDVEDLDLLKEAIVDIEPNITVSCVSNGKEVLDFIFACTDNDLPVLMILDYNMPKMTAAEVLLRLSAEKQYRAIRKLILSTSDSRSHAQDCLKYGAAGYFVKPGNMKELKALVKQMLANMTIG